MATTMPWLSGWPATRLRRRAAGARAIPAPSAPSLARGERVLLTLDGVVATDRAIYQPDAASRAGVATDRALYRPDAAARAGVAATPLASTPVADGWARLGWEQVSRADRHERGLVLTAWAPGVPPRTVLDVERATPLLALARERIAWTTLLTTRIPIGGHPAHVAVRRQPGPGTLVWMVALAPEVTPAPAVDEELAVALATLRREFS